jgi:hypothetical protein
LQFSMPRNFAELTLSCKRHIASLRKTRSCSRLPFDWLARQFRIGSQRGHHLGRPWGARWPASSVRVDSRRRHSSSLGRDLRTNNANGSRDSLGS